MTPHLHILLVEDHPDVAQLFAMVLTSRGHTVKTTASVAGAKKALGSTEFDLLLCDFRIGEETGIDLIKWVRATGSRVRSICLSGYGKEFAEPCRQAGFDDFLTKPVDVAVLERLAAAPVTPA